MKRAIMLNERDNVATVLHEGAAGDEYAVEDPSSRIVCTVRASTAIPFAHKVALQTVGEGEDVIKCGFSIGKAVSSIPTGALVHVHNLTSVEGRRGAET